MSESKQVLEQMLDEITEDRDRLSERIKALEAENKELREELSSARESLIGTKPTWFYTELKKKEKEIEELKEERVKIVGDAWDECDKYKGWVTTSELESKKSTYLKQFKQ